MRERSQTTRTENQTPNASTSPGVNDDAPPARPVARTRSALGAWRNAILGTLLVGCGLVVAIVTSWARRNGDWELARIGAITSLVFVVLITIFVVPPLLRS
ncbi:MAG TPA: hypothetical protein VGB05_05215, partial [Pyrinomonadaceae bacterium]